jgi:threonine dehydrogenase-like Zn-dependent dehydrogenase
VRAIRFDGGGAVLDSKAPAPVAGPGEAVVRVIRAGVSAADGAVAGGARPDGLVAGTVLGQEFVGTVESLHETAEKDLRKRWIGMRIAASVNLVCAQCDLCRAGLQAHCRTRRVLGLSADGCLAEAIGLPLRNLHPVPREVGDDVASFAVPLSCAIHAAQLVRLEEKPFVTVLGDGVEGLLAAQVMVRLNASVRVLGTRAEHFGLCEKWGIKHRHTQEAGRRADQDIVVDCTGTAAGFGLALQLVRPRGKVVLLARGAGSGPNAALGPVIEHEIEVLGARAGSVPDALAVLSRGEVDVLPLITRRCRLADGPAALLAAAAPGQLKVLVDP